MGSKEIGPVEIPQPPKKRWLRVMMTDGAEPVVGHPVTVDDLRRFLGLVVVDASDLAEMNILERALESYRTTGATPLRFIEILRGLQAGVLMDIFTAAKVVEATPEEKRLQSGFHDILQELCIKFAGVHRAVRAQALIVTALALIDAASMGDRRKLVTEDEFLELSKTFFRKARGIR